MPTERITESSDSPGQTAQMERRGYLDAFGEPVPASLLKFCANTGQYWELDKALQQQIAKGEPVKDWERFAEPFLAPYKATD